MGRVAKTSQYTEDENKFWEEFVSREGQIFTTLRGLECKYAVRGNEVFFDRKEKSITRATVMQGYRKALELKEAGVSIDGPKKLGVFGASYLFPVFQVLGLFNQ